MFAVEPAAVTVPAGGEAQVSITVDTRVGATDGMFAGALVATGAGQSLRTTIAVDREVESYDLELVHIDRDGNPGIGSSAVLDLDSAGLLALDPVVGTSTTRLPRGRYMRVQSQWAEPGPGSDFLNGPYTYDLSFFPEPGRYPDGFERSVENADLAAVRNSYAAQAPGQFAVVNHFPTPDAEFFFTSTQGLQIDPRAYRLRER